MPFSSFKVKTKSCFLVNSFKTSVQTRPKQMEPVFWFWTVKFEVTVSPGNIFWLVTLVPSEIIISLTVSEPMTVLPLLPPLKSFVTLIEKYAYDTEYIKQNNIIMALATTI